MTILNVSRTPARVLVAVDTLGGAPGDDSSLEVTKMLHLPVPNVVLACRGVAALLYAIFDSLVKQIASFDEYAGGLVEICNATVVPMRARLLALGIERPLVDGNLELVMAGWSDQAEAMRAVCYRKPAGQQRFHAHEVETYLLMPGEPWAREPNPLAPLDADAMLVLGQRQFVWWQKNLPQYPAGGRFLVGSLTREGWAVESSGIS